MLFRSYKNTERGFYLQWSHQAIIINGLFVDNQVGIFARFSDNLTITNTAVKGQTNVTRALTRPPFLRKLCPSTKPVIGLQMNTYINDSGDTKGLTMRNVSFTDFDSSADCIGSVAISFNPYDKRDGHFDYITSFKNVSISDTRNRSINACDAQQNLGTDEIGRAHV